MERQCLAQGCEEKAERRSNYCLMHLRRRLEYEAGKLEVQPPQQQEDRNEVGLYWSVVNA